MVQDNKLSFVELFGRGSQRKRKPRAFIVGKNMHQIIVEFFCMLDPSKDGVIFSQKHLFGNMISFENLWRQFQLIVGWECCGYVILKEHAFILNNNKIRWGDNKRIIAWVLKNKNNENKIYGSIRRKDD